MLLKYNYYFTCLFSGGVNEPNVEFFIFVCAISVQDTKLVYESITVLLSILETVSSHKNQTTAIMILHFFTLPLYCMHIGFGSCTKLIYHCGIVKVLEDSSMDFHWLVGTVIHGDDKVEEVALSHILRRLLLKAGRNQLMAPIKREHK